MSAPAANESHAFAVCASGDRARARPRHRRTLRPASIGYKLVAEPGTSEKDPRSVWAFGSVAVKDLIERIVRDHAERPGPLLLVLHAVQKELGYVPDESIALIAEGLNLSRAEVHGVVSFYHYFRRAPSGEHIVRVCRAESCQAMNGEGLALHAQQRLQIAFHETTDDGRFSLEPVYCLGNCACSPAIMIDDELHGRVSAERFDALITACESKT